MFVTQKQYLSNKKIFYRPTPLHGPHFKHDATLVRIAELEQRSAPVSPIKAPSKSCFPSLPDELLPLMKCHPSLSSMLTPLNSTIAESNLVNQDISMLTRDVRLPSLVADEIGLRPK
jgi:hypothetical protein